MKMFSQQAIEHQNMLLRISTERAEAAYHKSKKQKICNPVVLILDLDDHVARVITRKAKRDEEMDSFIRRGQQQNGSPIVIWHMPSDYAVDLLPQSNGEISDTLNNWRGNEFQNRFPAVVVGAGMVSIVALLIPSTESS